MHRNVPISVLHYSSCLNVYQSWHLVNRTKRIQGLQGIDPAYFGLHYVLYTLRGHVRTHAHFNTAAAGQSESVSTHQASAHAASQLWNAHWWAYSVCMMQVADMLKISKEPTCDRERELSGLVIDDGLKPAWTRDMLVGCVSNICWDDTCWDDYCSKSEHPDIAAVGE